MRPRNKKSFSNDLLNWVKNEYFPIPTFKSQHNNNPTLTKASLIAKSFWELSLTPLGTWTEAQWSLGKKIPVLTPYLLKLCLPNNYQNWQYWNFCLSITKLQASPCSLRNTGTKGMAQWVSMPAVPLWETEFEFSEHERWKHSVRARVGRWKMETGESLGVGRPANLAYTVEKQ